MQTDWRKISKLSIGIDLSLSCSALGSYYRKGWTDAQYSSVQSTVYIEVSTLKSRVKWQTRQTKWTEENLLDPLLFPYHFPLLSGDTIKGNGMVFCIVLCCYVCQDVQQCGHHWPTIRFEQQQKLH